MRSLTEPHCYAAAGRLAHSSHSVLRCRMSKLYSKEFLPLQSNFNHPSAARLPNPTALIILSALEVNLDSNRMEFIAMRMTPHAVALGLAFAAGLSLPTAQDAAALSAKECGEKYQADKTAGKLGGLNWNDYRKAKCSADAAEPTKADLRKPVLAKETVKDAPKVTFKAGKAVFPKSVSAKYASEAAGKARMHTCRDQYAANKASNANGGMRWIEKGGGYYSQCVKALKS